VLCAYIIFSNLHCQLLQMPEINFLFHTRDTGRKVEDPDLLEQIRLTIINNLLKYHPVCLQFSLSLYRNHIHIQRGLHAAVFFFLNIAFGCFAGMQ